MLPSVRDRPGLAEMALADAPDFATALAAGEARGLSPRDALKSAFGKWVTENAEAVQRYAIASLHGESEKPGAMVNYSRLAQVLAIQVADLTTTLQETRRELAEVRKLLPETP